MPLTKRRFNRYKDKINPWISTGILNSIKHKDNLYKRWKKNLDTQQTDIFKAEFKNFERELKRIINEAKKSYYFKEFSNCRNDMRRTWKSIKEIINKNRRKANFPGKLKLGDLTFTDDLRIANKFNDFFINAGNINRGPLLTNHNDYLNDNVQSSFTFSNTSSVEV